MERGEAVSRFDTSADAPESGRGTTPVGDIVATIADTIAIFAPGGYDADPDRLPRAAGFLESRGCRTSIALTVGQHHDRFSATDDERLRWLAEVTRAPGVGIAMALRGGYGATRLLPRIDFFAMATAVRGRGKRFVGHSDFTAIELGLLATTGAISFAGPMASFDFGGPNVDPFMESHFWRAMREARVDVDFPVDDRRSLDVEGTLWGGNLAMLCSLIGTPWMPMIDRGVLFIEDINEQPYRVERMLIQLQQAGVIDRQQVVLCGDLSGHRVAAYDRGYDVGHALEHLRSTTSVPIVRGLPFGHCPRKLTLAVGARASVALDGGVCRLRQHWDLSAS